MLHSNSFFNKNFYPGLRYWAGWLLLFALLALALHGYLDYRTRELDKRIERLKT